MEQTTQYFNNPTIAGVLFHLDCDIFAEHEAGDGVLCPLIALQLRQTPLRGSDLRGGWRRLNSVRRRQISVQGRDHLRAFSDCGGDALDRPRTDVADRINSTTARFQWAPVFADFRSGQHEALGVERHARSRQPDSIRVGTDKEE